MPKRILNRKKLNPGVPVFTGVEKSEDIKLQLFQYNKANYIEESEFLEKNIKRFPEDDYCYWLNTHGIHDRDLIISICEKMGVHQLAMQDILDINQRAKFQEYDNYWFFSLKSVLPSKGLGIELEQISFILGKNFLISFQEKVADYFNHIRARIREDLGIMRERGPDYLLYLMFESILDNYFKTINSIEIRLEELKIADNDSDPSPETVKLIERYKRQVHQIKKNVIPIKEFMVTIERAEFGMIDQRHIKYYLELKDLCLTLIDECDYFELKLESNINLFFSVQGHKMNMIMKTLTVVATIFIPLTFLAGIYGMNFTNMPELGWKWGYFAIWIIMLSVFVGMVIYFKRKKWY